VSQPIKGARTQTPLSVDVGDHQCVVCADKHMVSPLVWKEVSQRSKYGQNLQAVYVPCEMMTFPKSLGRAATHDCPPACEGGVRC